MSDSGYILGVELIGTDDGLNVAGERKRGIRDESKIYGLNSVSGGNGAANDQDH